MLKERLRQARQAKGWTLDELAARLIPPVTRGTVSHWEAGRSAPKRDNLMQLARIFGVSAAWLHGETDEGGPQAAPVMRRDLLRKVEIALEGYLQAQGLDMEPEGRWQAVESLYDWAADNEPELEPGQPVRIESVRAFLRGLRPRG